MKLENRCLETTGVGILGLVDKVHDCLKSSASKRSSISLAVAS